MQRPVNEARAPSKVGLLLRRWLRWFFVAIVIIFALLGAATTVIFLVSWASDGHWAAGQFQTLIALERAIRALLKISWDHGPRGVQYLSFFLLAAALFLAVIRVKAVGKIIGDFIVARGPIYSLQSTIIEVSNTVDKLSNLQPTMELLSEKIDAEQEQLAELQRYTASQQAQAGGANWEKLRELWYANTRRIDGVIDRIPGTRRKQRYRKMPRSNYTPIIQALAKVLSLVPQLRTHLLSSTQRSEPIYRVNRFSPTKQSPV